MKENATTRISSVKQLYEKELVKLRVRYTEDISTLENHIQIIEEKLVHLHLELNGEENVDDLEIPTYELEPLQTLSVDAEQLVKVKYLETVVASADLAQCDESLRNSIQGSICPSPTSLNRSAQEIMSRLNVSAKSPPKFSSHSNEVAEVKKENRVLRTKLKELSLVRVLSTSPCQSIEF